MSEASKSVHTALVGRTCEAFFEQKWYNGDLIALLFLQCVFDEF